MNKKIALIGNPNSGKTTLFNVLTGTYQKTGNWSGVTTEKKEGQYLLDKSVTIIDLPGLYSLTARSKDERAVIDFFKSQRPDVIVNVVDGTNLTRNLLLTTYLLELKIPVVIAVNFCDQLKKQGAVLDAEKMENVLSAPIVTISALKKTNVDKLMDIALSLDRVPYFDLKDNKSTRDRYAFLDKSVPLFFYKKNEKGKTFTQKIDDLLLGKKTGLPIFIVVMLMVYFVSIRLGGVFGGMIENAFNSAQSGVMAYFTAKKVPNWITSLSCEAVIGGIGTVLSFLPQILILFALLSILEQSGYCARTSFLLDRIFRSIGLSGKSFIPMMLGCGCTVSGIMATRTIERESERVMTIYLTPFIPCGAKTAVFGWFASLLFNGSAFVATAMYFLGILCVCTFGRILKRLKIFRDKSAPFILEIPTLKIPHVKDVWFVLKDKVKDFLTKAGLIVFVFSVILWALRNLGFSGYTYGDVKKSFLYIFGNKLKYIFYPLGFASWETAVAVLSGIFAKEAVIETLTLLSKTPATLFSSPFSALSFTAFILLSPPCIASISMASSELKSKKLTFYMLIFHLFTAYTVSLAINLLGILINACNRLILPVIIVIIIVVTLVLAIKRLKKCKKDCANCSRGEKCKRTEKHFTT
ncbi:MAG: ferrous iron transporter B [Clostridia bacterium]|nr:ferrous iron transporter B [Clostridia bacterium]